MCLILVPGLCVCQASNLLLIYNLSPQINILCTEPDGRILYVAGHTTPEVPAHLCHLSTKQSSHTQSTNKNGYSVDGRVLSSASDRPASDQRLQLSQPGCETRVHNLRVGFAGIAVVTSGSSDLSALEFSQQHYVSQSITEPAGGALSKGATQEAVQLSSVSRGLGPPTSLCYVP